MQYTLSILVENQAGVLSKISGLFSRRGFNIDSLAVGVTQDPSVSRITIVANGDEYIVEQLEKQLNKLIPVIKVKRLNEGEFISRELVLIKVHCAASKRAEIVKSRINTLVDLLKPYGIREIVRTGTVAIDRGTASVSV